MKSKKTLNESNTNSKICFNVENIWSLRRSQLSVVSCSRLTTIFNKTTDNGQLTDYPKEDR
jgi:hypothetical protein